MKQQRKELIIQAHAAACSEWKQKIETEFSKLFKKDELVVGQWYKSNGFLRRFNGKYGNGLAYGFRVDGSYCKSLGFHREDPHLPATDKEVSEALIAEAKKRGYKNGNYDCLSGFITLKAFDIHSYYYNDGYIWITNSKGNNLIFKDGVWAEIIEEPVNVLKSDLELAALALKEMGSIFSYKNAEIIEEPVYEWQYIYDGFAFGMTDKSNSYYTSKKEFKKILGSSLTPIKKVKGSKRIRK